MEQHTPTPWKVTKAYPYGLATFIESEKVDALICEVDKHDLNAGNEGDAAFIVRAVNSYEELLEVAKRALGCGALPERTKRALERAIEKAEGK